MLRHRGIDAEEISEEDIEAAESEMAFNTHRSLVMDDMVKPSHPIIVGVNNICELVKNKKLGSLKLAVLKEICNQLHLTTSGPPSRKKTFFEAIEKFSESCTFSKITSHGFPKEDLFASTLIFSIGAF